MFSTKENADSRNSIMDGNASINALLFVKFFEVIYENHYRCEKTLSIQCFNNEEINYNSLIGMCVGVSCF